MSPISLVRIASVVSFLTLGAATAGAQPVMPLHAKIDLVTEAASFEPGKTAWLGLLFDLEKGWHIYWVNPGDSGDPPRIKWELPEGFSAGAIKWPVPERLVSAMTADYGYQGKVLLPLPLQVPASYTAGAPATVAGDVRYLICREVCIPARTRVTLTIPGVAAAGLDHAAVGDLFRKAREEWAQPLPAGSSVQATDEGQQIVLRIETGARESAATFFPLEAEQIDNGAPQALAPDDRGVRITLKKSELLQDPITTLKGVVVLGPGRQFEIAAPVTPKP